VRSKALCTCAFATAAVLVLFDSGIAHRAAAASDGESGSRGGFFRKLNPFKSTYESFDGRFIDTIDASPGANAKTTNGSGLILHQTHGRGVVNAPHLQRYLGGIADRLLAHSPVTNVTAVVFIEAHDSIIPQSEGDGTIFVPLGLLRQATSEDEIAAALAHELSHIVLGHHGDAWFVEGQRRALGLSGLGTDYATAVGTSLSDDVAADKLADATADVEKQRSNVRLALLTSDIFVQSSFDRKKEDQADLLGVDLLIASGYNVRAMYHVLEWVGAYEERRKERIGDLEQEVEARVEDSLSNRSAGNPLRLFGGVLGKAGARVAGALRGAFGRDYRPAAERIDDLKGYVARSYDPPPNPRPKKAAWESAKNQPHTRVVLAHYRDARDAYNELLEGDATRAAALGVRGISSPTSSAAYPRWVMYSVRAHQGRDRDAVANLRAAMQDPHPPLSVVLALSEHSAKDGNLKDALRLLEDADRRYENPPQTLPLKIAIYRRLGRSADASETYAKCRLIQNDDLTNQCQAAQEIPLSEHG
jgi:predicted Zn-dependent protease